jgi:hypothetical protein
MEKQTINNAYANLTITREELHAASQAAIMARIDLETETARATLAGEIVGKNAEERAAKAREILADHFNALEACESSERRARLDFDLAGYEVERVKLVIRAEELEAKFCGE